MRDSGFYVSTEQASRVAEPQVDPGTGKRTYEPNVENLTKETQKWISGGGGMLSTAADYARFCQMLLNGGELDDFWVDPKEKLFAVMMMQIPFAESGYYRRAMREVVYGALVE